MDTNLGLLYSPGIFSAGLSTISAALNSLAAVTLEDYLKPVYKKCTGYEFSPTKSASIAKVFALMFGIISIALAFLAQFLGGLLQVMFIIVICLCQINENKFVVIASYHIDQDMQILSII